MLQDEITYAEEILYGLHFTLHWPVVMYVYCTKMCPQMHTSCAQRDINRFILHMSFGKMLVL